MPGKSRKGVPALKNDEVTGMTEEKQDEVIRESARAPRGEAAKRRPARLAGLEPATTGLEGRCSIQLSYRRKGAPGIT